MQNIQKEIIIINDCSTDSSKEKIQFFIEENKNLNTHFLNHKENKGKDKSDFKKERSYLFKTLS